MFFRSYDQPPLAAPIDLARQVVFGAVDYLSQVVSAP
jgi:hypothetical protein